MSFFNFWGKIALFNILFKKSSRTSTDRNVTGNNNYSTMNDYYIPPKTSHTHYRPNLHDDWDDDYINRHDYDDDFDYLHNDHDFFDDDY